MYIASDAWASAFHEAQMRCGTDPNARLALDRVAELREAITRWWNHPTAITRAELHEAMLATGCEVNDPD
jgi:hypothetical protein